MIVARNGYAATRWNVFAQPQRSLSLLDLNSGESAPFLRSPASGGSYLLGICAIFFATCGSTLGGGQEAPTESSLAAVTWPDPEWQRVAPSATGMDEARLSAARQYALRGDGSGYVTRHGKLVMSWGDPNTRYDLKSTTKSFGSIALGLAIKDGTLQLQDRAKQHHPHLGLPPETNLRDGWLDEITILHLATQTAGFEKPGGFTQLLFRPGTQWDYSDSGPNWLAECITLACQRDLKDWMFQRVFTPLGINDDDLQWRTNAYRPATIENLPRREFGSGISANVDAMARVGYLMLRRGRWMNQQILTPEYVDLAATTPQTNTGLPVRDPETYGHAASHYGLLWWNNSDGTLRDVPRDAFWSWGLYDSLILVIPSLDIVVARAGKSWPREPKSNHYDVLHPFFQPIAAAVTDPSGVPESDTAGQSHANSPVIRRVTWDPLETILRLAKGSDNWPATWADDLGYVYSHDSNSAYNRSDAMVLARVSRQHVRRKTAYEFFAGFDSPNRPQWTSDIQRREAVFTSPGRCYRSTVSYNAPLQRYLWVQTGLGEDTRFNGGLAIYDAAEPWGPWTLVFSTEHWDVGPGETASFPTKWIRADGQRMYLLFSGNDHFCVRGCSLELHDGLREPLNW